VGAFPRKCAAMLRSAATEESGGLHISFIFLLHPYSIPEITKTRPAETGREQTVEGYFALEFLVLKASTHSRNQLEPPQCTGPVRNGGSRSL
jgi:hypothetical protein